MKYVLAIDQGTSSTKAIVFDEMGQAVCKGQADLHTNYYENGHVEQDPEGIFQNVIDAVLSCLNAFVIAGNKISEIASCGISNQRETFVLFDKNGSALTPAVVWACKRSIQICEKLKAAGQEDEIKQKTGLVLDPYFSGTKLLWLLENDSKLKAKLDAGELYFGTIDTWLLFKMSQGKSYKTDHTNASRTLLFNINTLSWDADILKQWGLENLHLPEICPSSHNFGTWEININSFLNKDSSHITHHSSINKDSSLITHHSFLNKNSSLNISALIGDSHAAAFGESCFEAGSAKITLGTGCSILLNTGNKAVISKHGMLSTICFSTENQVFYALEGAIVACGSTIEWLKNELNLFENVLETSEMANTVPDNGGVYLIPAFSGLGAPHWQMTRRASIEGMNFGSTKNHIIRAALESIPFQIKDVLVAMSLDTKTTINQIAINGGLTANTFVLSYLSDLLGIGIRKQDNPDISALGAAYLSGLNSKVFKDLAHIKRLNDYKNIVPSNTYKNTADAYAGWVEKVNK
jgi:glycerol kinase